MLGEWVEEDEEGRVGEMDVGGWVGGGRGGGAEELEAWADMMGGNLVVYEGAEYKQLQLGWMSFADVGCMVVEEAELWSEIRKMPK